MSADEDDASLEMELAKVLDSGDADEAKAEETERLYRRDGRRFVADTKDASGEPKPGEPKPEAAPVDAKAAPAAKPWRPTWYKDEYGQWDKLSDGLKTALREQERNAAQAIEKHSTSAKTWDPVNAALQPYAQELAANGVSPQEYVSRLINADAYLRESPMEALEWLSQTYLGADIQSVADWMRQQGHTPAKIDPMQQKIQALEQKLNAFESKGVEQQRAVLDKQVADWARDKPDFAAVRQDMAVLAKRYPEASLDDLYERARWAHPDTRERILQEKEDKRLADLKRARAAGATSPRGSQSSASARSKPTMTLEEEIAMNLDGGV